MNFDYFVGPERQHVDDSFITRYHTLVAKGEKSKADNLRGEWAENRSIVDLGELPNLLQSPSIDLTKLPFGSFYIQFQFKLLKPYLSRDDNQFYIVDNPIVRDKVFRLPMVRPTTWKGSLRHALWQLEAGDDAQIRRLFGAANDDDGTGKRGRLYFYPTFFTETRLEVINPHDRERRVGKNPILLESVPADATGTFSLLYTPLDRIGQDEAETRKQTFADLQLVAKGLQAMFTVYGFGAKTSSGFGLADDAVDGGTLVLKISDFTFSQEKELEVQPPDDAFHKYLDETGVVNSNFRHAENGELLSNREYKEQGEQLGGSLSEFKKFRQWYGDHGKQWQAYQKTKQVDTADPTYPFKQLGELAETCANIKPTSAKAKEETA